MALGPGKYDQECETILMLHQCDAVMVAVLGGARGSGFSVSMDNAQKNLVLWALPQVLRAIADQIEKDSQEIPKERTDTDGIGT